MSANIDRIFQEMPTRYRSGSASSGRYYFSIGDHKYTVELSPEACVVTPGKSEAPADYVLKTTPELFEKMVLRGKMPGPLDVARGKVKTNDPRALAALRQYFDFAGL